MVWRVGRKGKKGMVCESQKPSSKQGEGIMDAWGPIEARHTTHTHQECPRPPCLAQEGRDADTHTQGDTQCLAFPPDKTSKPSQNAATPLFSTSDDVCLFASPLLLRAYLACATSPTSNLPPLRRPHRSMSIVQAPLLGRRRSRLGYCVCLCGGGRGKGIAVGH